ncbi:hypothetical protein [Streptomyces sp. NPDC001530]|uniref:hypothetical protein n=1 Tax=Streptomyces sp. NPDC001530 TaxID=3364582 RepID=UPI0036772968
MPSGARRRARSWDCCRCRPLAACAGVLQAAVEDRRLARNPCRASTVRPSAAAPGRVDAWPPERVLAVRTALPERYRVLVETGTGLGLGQGEAFGLCMEDIDFDEEAVHVRRQVKMVRTKLCFALPKGRKVRDGPCPTPVEAKHRRPRTYNLLVTGCERMAINRNCLNSCVWKPALAESGVIAALEETPRTGLVSGSNAAIDAVFA